MHSQLLDTVQHGQLITLYSVAISKYNEIKDITITNETSVEVTETLYTVSLLVINSYSIHSMLVQYVTNLAYFVANIVHFTFYKASLYISYPMSLGICISYYFSLNHKKYIMTVNINALSSIYSKTNQQPLNQLIT